MKNEKNFELKTLIFNDGDKFRSFMSSDFNFILDKESGLSICYGSSPEETPTYDPLSPEVIDVEINKDFNFDEQIENINKLFNIKKEKDDKLITISTISTVNLIIDNIYDENIKDVTKFYEYLNKFKIYVNLVVSHESVKELRDILRLKLFNINDIIVKSEEFKAKELLDQINLILSKNLNVSCDFYISKNNYEEFISLIDLGFPGNTFSNIIFKDNVNKNIKNKVISSIDNKGNFNICYTKKNRNDKLNYKSILLYQDSLFKCYINFNNKTVSYSCDEDECIPFDKIERIDSYWHSSEFEKYRFSLISKKYEDISEEELKKEVKEKEEMKIQSVTEIKSDDEDYSINEMEEK